MLHGEECLQKKLERDAADKERVMVECYMHPDRANELRDRVYAVCTPDTVSPGDVWRIVEDAVNIAVQAERQKGAHLMPSAIEIFSCAGGMAD